MHRCEAFLLKRLLKDSNYKHEEAKARINLAALDISTKLRKRRWSNGMGGGVALMLDDPTLGSTRALRLMWADKPVIQLAQHDSDHFKRMSKKLRYYRNIVIIHGDYSELKYVKFTIALDMADYCGGFDTHGHSILFRLRGCAYTDGAIIRITFNRRSPKGGAYHTIMDDIADAADEGGYVVEAVHPSRWSYMGDLTQSPDSIDGDFFVYGKQGSRMYTLILRVRVKPQERITRVRYLPDYDAFEALFPSDGSWHQVDEDSLDRDWMRLAKTKPDREVPPP
jgi:hypothetical protein